ACLRLRLGPGRAWFSVRLSQAWLSRGRLSARRGGSRLTVSRDHTRLSGSVSHRADLGRIRLGVSTPVDVLFA
ncbi:MAG: hypothetical protein M3Z75_13410, partial [Actinomycetota bacterium]|nr:hypothetical protein [Actinomycetota bacterium]